MATSHFICGKAASGKTTLARELAARHAAVLFGEDEWLTRLDAEINNLADDVRHSKRLKAAFAPRRAARGFINFVPHAYEGVRVHGRWSPPGLQPGLRRWLIDANVASAVSP